ncbi:MAG: phosphoethanolamine transferase [Paludibacteraceae bacterium]|nr:phosphoethanolamine transferase [Paludibacteraceae bacterium]
MKIFRNKRSSGNYYSYDNRSSEFTQYKGIGWNQHRRLRRSRSGERQPMAPLWLSVPLTLLLLLPNIMALFMAGNLGGVGERLLYLLATLLLFMLPACVVRARTFFLIQSPLLLFGIVELVHLFVNRATTSLLFVYTCLIAEPGEFKELMSNYLALILLVLVIWGAYFYVVIKRLPRDGWLMPLTARQVAGAAGGLLLALLLFVAPLRQTVGKACPFDFYAATWRIHHISRQISKGQQQADGFSFEARVDSTKQDALIVLIIGETARYDHFGLNGYERPTTPRLSERRNLYSYDSIYTVCNLTTVCVPMMLNRATPQQPQPLAGERSLQDALHEAGYQTAWIANQSYANRMLKPIAMRCDKTIYMPADEPESTHDFGLLTPLAEVMADSGRQFVTVHSLGCHFEYNKRYPEAFRQYTPDEGGNMMRDRELLTNSYDNAIYYTDCFIDSVITMLEQSGRPAVMFYVADHGENLLDDERGLFLHGTYEGSLYEYHVPLLVWTSDAYRKQHRQLEETMQTNKAVRQSTMTVFHTLLQLSDVTLPTMDTCMSLVHPALIRPDTIYRLDANLNCVPLPER